MRSSDRRTGKLTSVGLFAALTFLATFVLKIPTPAFGYVHIGDGFVLMAGFLLGPIYGGLAAGIGAALSDLLGGYAAWVPGTFLIKFLTAAAAACVLRAFRKYAEEGLPGSRTTPLRPDTPFHARVWALLTAGIAGETVMTAGYFLYNTFIVAVMSGRAADGIAAAAALSAAEIPFNLIQGGIGIVLSLTLYPVLSHAAARRRICLF